LIQQHLTMCFAKGLLPERSERAYREMYGLATASEEVLTHHRIPQGTVAPAPGTTLSWPPGLVAAVRGRLPRPPAQPTSVTAPDEPEPSVGRRKHRRRGGSVGAVAFPEVDRLPEREVLLWLHKLYYDDRYRRGRQRIPLKAVAEMAGLNRDTLYLAPPTSTLPAGRPVAA
jgi:hypothetical protein